MKNLSSEDLKKLLSQLDPPDKRVLSNNKKNISIREFRKRFFEKALQFVNIETLFHLKEIFDDVLKEMRNEK